MWIEKTEPQYSLNYPDFEGYDDTMDEAVRIKNVKQYFQGILRSRHVSNPNVNKKLKTAENLAISEIFYKLLKR